MARAEPGQILATDVVLERSRTTFETTPIEPFAAKGKAEPVKASLVGPIAGRREERIAETPFVGRERELERAPERPPGGRYARSSRSPARPESERRASFAKLSPRRPGCECSRQRARSTRHRPRTTRSASRCGSCSASRPTAVHQTRNAPCAPPLRTQTPSSSPGYRCSASCSGSTCRRLPRPQALDERFLRETLADVTCRFLAARLERSAVRARGGGRAVHGRLERRPLAPGVEGGRVSCRTRSSSRERNRGDSGRTPRTRSCATSPSTCCRSPSARRPRSSRSRPNEQPFRPHEVEELARRSGGSPLFLVELLNVARAAGTTDELPDSVEAVVTADIDRLSAC